MNDFLDDDDQVLTDDDFIHEEEDEDDHLHDALSPTMKGNEGGGKGSAMTRIDYQVLSKEDIKAFQQSDISQVSDLCGVSTSIAHALLSHYKWNKERMLEDFMEDSDRVFSKAGLAREPPKISRATADFSCSICCADLDEDQNLQVVHPECGHSSCINCFRLYLHTKIISEGESRKITCLGVGCTQVINSDFIKELISDQPKTLEKYNNLLFRSFVNDSDILRWCPAPNCDNVIKCSILPSQLNSIVPTVTCTCSTSFCFGCLSEPHNPCICRLVKVWLKKCADDSETANWINANTKECTQCRYTIEKNGGCNHMTCKNCKYEFCWVCLGPWSEHGTSYYNCNRFDESSSKDARNAQHKSRAALERYLHYFNRYNNHQQSAKLANDFFARTEKKMEELQLTSDFSWIEVQFMKKALEVVIECRNTLRWTYAFAYYLDQNNQSVLFEDNQRDLEIAVESLNELIESPLPDRDDSAQKEKLFDLKQQCLDKTEYCSKRRIIVLEDTARGLLEERWKFIE